MSLYQAFVLTSRTTFGGGACRVFLIRKEEAFNEEKLKEIRSWLSDKYLQDLKPTDLEVVEVENLKERLKQVLGRARPKST